MASSRLILFVFLAVLLNFVSCSCGRKMLEVQEFNKKMAPPQPPLDARLYLTSLPKGKVPASSPSKKGHSLTTDEKLVARNLAAIDRSLRSVPSPGIGH